MSRDRSKSAPPGGRRKRFPAPAVLAKPDAAASNPLEHLTPGLLPPWVTHTPRPQPASPPKASTKTPPKAPSKTAPAKGLHVEVIDRFEAFATLRADWDAVYAADPEAHLFLSWGWFENWLRRRDDGWFVLVAKPRADAPRAVAFWPLRIGDKKWKDSWFYNEVQPACGFADCTGLLCLPDFETQAFAAFGEHLGRLSWAQINVDKLRISDRRLALLVPHLPAAKTEIKVVDSQVESGIDLFRCPYVDLPADWETYLAERLSTNNRQKVRRFLKKVEHDDGFRITHADAGTIERDIEILLRLWAARWGAIKGDRLDGIMKSSRLMLLGCFKSDMLVLPVLWKGDKPLAAHAILKDARKKAMLFFMGGRDQEFKELPPAFVLHAHAIRQAIAEGFRTYDFLRGDEPYKFVFATDEYRLRRVLVTTKDRRNLGGKLLPRSLPYAFKRSFELHQEGNVKQAAIGYRQILDVDPRSPDALFGLGQILAARGDHSAAMDTFKTYLAIKAAPTKG